MRIAYILLGLLWSLNLSAGLIDSTCWEESCLENGWTLSGLNFQMDVQCVDDNCSENGWITYDYNSGVSHFSQCIDDSCFTEGWVTVDRWSKIKVESVYCQANPDDDDDKDCHTYGWRSYEPDGYRYSTVCLEDDCLEEGWSMRLPGRGYLKAECKSEGCFVEGWRSSTYLSPMAPPKRLSIF